MSCGVTLRRMGRQLTGFEISNVRARRVAFTRLADPS
jgi:hypothetical protein